MVVEIFECRICDPARDQIAQRKAYRLKVAQEIGLRIPATLMTNDPAEARRFVDARYDLRITAVGEQLFPAAIHSQQTKYTIHSSGA
jgi:hypothetical protein